MEEKTPSGNPPEKRPETASSKSSWGRSSTNSKPGTDMGSGTKWNESGTESGNDHGAEKGDIDDTRRIVKVDKLGAGSFGEVWLVEYLGALEAHKSLGPRARKDAFREAVNTRSVNHPNVVKVMDVIDDEGIPTLRMEYVEGKDLQRMIVDEGIIPVERLLPLAIQVADALRATHERGIVHLDLKPSNMILRKGGKHVVVTDFGISAALRLHDGELKGGRGGTPYFMAPELHQSDGVGSPQSDIWSLGVTLYYLVAGTYPFPFGEMTPAKAVIQKPTDLNETHPYVSRAFWQVIKKMLAADPKQRPASMQDVMLDLEELAGSLRCPECSQVFRFDSIAGVCPNPDCQSDLVVPLKSGLLLQKAATSALANCAFAEAESNGKKALGEFKKVGTDAQVTREMASFLKAIPGLQKDHDDSVAACNELIETNKLIDGIHRTNAARIRFSRSGQIRNLQMTLRDKFVDLYSSAADTVHSKIRNRDFEGARAYLSRVDHMLGDKIASRELQEKLSEDARDLSWLHEDINRQQKAFQVNQEKGRQALVDFDFKLALEAYTYLESNFPAEEGRTMLSSLGRAAGLYEKQNHFSAGRLRELIDDPAKANGLEDLSLEESSAACNRLIESFPADKYPSFISIQEKSDLFQQAGESLKTFVTNCLQQAEDAQKSKNLLEENLVLDMVKGIVLRSDLFDARMRAFVQERLRTTSQGVTEAERLYREGKKNLSAREYPKALANFREVQRIAPGTYEDLDTLLSQVDEAQEQFRSAKSQVLECFGRVERGDFDLHFSIESLEKAETFFHLADDQERKRWFPEVAGCFLRVLDSQREHLEKTNQTDEASGTERASFFYDNLIPLLDVLPGERWNELVKNSRELRRSICELFLVVGQMQKMTYQDIAKLINPLLTVMTTEKLGEILTLCMPPQGAVHPAQKWSESLINAFRRAPLAIRNQHASDGEELLEKLAGICPPELQETVNRALVDLRRSSRQASLVSLLQLWKEQAFKHRYAAGVVLLVGIIFLFIGKSMGRESAFSWVPGEVDRIGLANAELSGALTDLIDQADEPGDIIARIGLLQGWANLKNTLVGEDGQGGDNKRLQSMLEMAVVHRATIDALIKNLNGNNKNKVLQKLHDALMADVEKGAFILVERIAGKAANTLATGHPEEENHLPVLRSKFQVLLDIVPIRKIKLLRQRLEGFEAILGDDILAPLREGRWADFNPEETLRAISLREMGLNNQIQQDLMRVLKLELRRALILGLKDCLDATLRGGSLSGYSQVLGRIGNTLGRLPGLGSIDDKHAKGTLKLVLCWVNKCFNT